MKQHHMENVCSKTKSGPRPRFLTGFSHKHACIVHTNILGMFMRICESNCFYDFEALLIAIAYIVLFLRSPSVSFCICVNAWALLSESNK